MKRAIFGTYENGTIQWKSLPDKKTKYQLTGTAIATHTQSNMEGKE